VSGVG